MEPASICPTCLSQGRDMFPFPLNYTKLPFSTFYRDLKLTPKDLICWECRSFILKMGNFRLKALRAQAHLAILQRKPWITLKSLSKLAISKGINLDIIDTTKSQDPLSAVNIKVETDMDFGANECASGEESNDNIQIEDIKEEITDVAETNEVVFEVYQHRTRVVPESSNQNLDMTNVNIANATLMSLLARKGSLLSFSSVPIETCTSTNPPDDINIEIHTHKPNQPETSGSQPINMFTEERLTEEEMRKWWEGKRLNKMYVESIPVFRCEVCVEPFNTERSLLGHQKMHTEAYGELACDICQLRFCTESALATHRDNHYRLLKCAYCNVTWDSPNTMRRHCQSEHGCSIDKWTCYVCPKQQDNQFEGTGEVADSSISLVNADCSVDSQRNNIQDATPPLPLASSSSVATSKKRQSNPKHDLNKNKSPKTVKRKKVTSDLDGKKTAGAMDDPKESSGSDNDEENGLSTVSFDINLEPALPVNMDEDARERLKKEDSLSDRTLLNMLPDLPFEWSDHPNNAHREEFIASPGPTFDLDNGTPFTIFRKFFDDDLLDFLVQQTNKNASALMNSVTTGRSRLLSWKNIDRDEMVVFLAIIILQSLAPLNSECDYWKENGYLTLKYFKDLMIYNKYLLIKRLLFNTQADMTGISVAQRKLCKMWPVLHDLNRKFSCLYIPQQNIILRESLLNWHGGRSFAQRMFAKAKGIKSYELCEAETGYLWSFCVYADTVSETNDRQHGITDFDSAMRDGQTESEQISALAPQNAVARIVKLLMPLLGYGYTLIIDNNYNSPLLARYLKMQKTDCFGTLRLNREYLPENIKLMSEIGVGDTVQSFCQDMAITVWRDRNLIALLSTFHGHCKEKPKPEVLLDYNKAMNGIEKKTQLLSAYPMERSGNQSWCIKVFRRLLNVTIHNAYVIFKTQNQITNRGFRERLAEEMITACRPKSKNVQGRTTLNTGGKPRVILDGNHFIGQGASKFIRCAWCKQSRTKYLCKQCNVSLCLEVCFEEYHTKP